MSQMKISIVKTSFDRSNPSNSSLFDMYQKVNNNRNGIQELDCRIFEGAKHSTKCRSSGTFISQMKISIVKTSFDRSTPSNSSLFDMYQKVNNNRNGI
jgi:hypothetical protein